LLAYIHTKHFSHADVGGFRSVKEEKRIKNGGQDG